jgi:PhzF family phenazine biosynthesis protein
MRLPYFQVSAFTASPFGGNPAGVCVLDRALPEPLLQRIAAENDLSETAFLTREAGQFRIRWFTPAIEVDLCGHATLASAHVLMVELGYGETCIQFQSRSGILKASRRGELIELDFPSRPPKPCAAPEQLLRGLATNPQEVLKSRDYLAVFASAAEVAALQPDMAQLRELDSLGVIATAPGENGIDFVSRFFAPRAGVPEDPVTGSSHCTLIPFWAERLKKKELFARQISKRGGELTCRDLGERVAIGGQAVVYFRGELEIPEPHR